MSRKEIIDNLMSKWISRKLLVFLIAVMAMFSDKISSEDFMIISVIYIGAQAATDVVMAIKKNNNIL